MLKFVLILHLCTFADISPRCIGTIVMPIEYNSYSDCILDGYIQAKKSLKELKKEDINKYFFEIKFECKETYIEKKDI